jgi:ComF family protein
MKPFLDILYPRSCIGCGKTAPKTFRYICWDCWANTVRVEAPFCACCGDPVSGAVEHDFICYSCSDEQPAFDAARSATRYDGVIGDALRKLKYEHALWLSPDLAAVLYNCIRAEFPEETFDLLVPVPLYHVRRRDRGFNQSAMLSGELARLLGTSSVQGVLRRIRPTTSQTNLTAKERLSNVNKAFKSRNDKRLAGRKVLLVDDVMTTGATVNACAKALKRGGAATVHVITVARG